MRAGDLVSAFDSWRSSITFSSGSPPPHFSFRRSTWGFGAPYSTDFPIQCISWPVIGRLKSSRFSINTGIRTLGGVTSNRA